MMAMPATMSGQPDRSPLPPTSAHRDDHPGDPQGISGPLDGAPAEPQARCQQHAGEEQGQWAASAREPPIGECVGEDIPRETLLEVLGADVLTLPGVPDLSQDIYTPEVVSGPVHVTSVVTSVVGHLRIGARRGGGRTRGRWI